MQLRWEQPWWRRERGLADRQRARGGAFFIYPDYFLFHVGGPLGDHSMLDIWPSHKEVVVPDQAEALLQAINDRAITWKNRYPQAIVDAFEAEGFIWGGRWYHYDTMHFEYRPELLGTIPPSGE